MSKNQFPANKGWIRLSMTLKRGDRFTEEEAQEYASFGQPDRLQFGLVDVSRNPVRLIYRELKNYPWGDPDLGDLPLVENPIRLADKLPFAAKCGNLTIWVTSVDGEGVAKSRKGPVEIILIRGQIIQGKYFNDAGNYGPGDTVCIGPITDHWKRLSLPQ